jgi:transposase
MSKVRFVGLDVHAQTIAVAVAEGDGGEVRGLGTIPHTVEALRKLVKQLGAPADLRACYEAGPTGYGVYWTLTQVGVDCAVVAPTLVPVKPGDRVKTDRRDAEKLARGLRAGDLTRVWVPDAAHEALRDVVRAREAAKGDQLRARHRLSKFLLRHSQRPPAGVHAWTKKHATWLTQGVQFAQAAQTATFLDLVHEVEHAAARIGRLEQALDEAIAAAPPTMQAVIAALQALRGVARLTAATVVAETGPLTRFPTARALMGYGGFGVREASSGAHTWRGGITKTGNAHLRRVAGEAAWAYRCRPAVGPALQKRQAGLSPQITALAWKAQHRLNARYRRLTGRGKPVQQVVTAIARELLGFMWAIGREVAAAPAA